MIPAAEPLRGISVLVTRPAHQSQHVIALLESAGAHAIPFPAIEILPVEATDTLNAQLAMLENFQIIIFISANAVEHGLNLIKNSGKSLKHADIVAIGNSTARALEKHQIPVAITPETDFTSEALLHMPRMQTDKIAGKKILIIRGTGGREHLAQTLRSRGAQVDYLEVYQRKRPETDHRLLNELWSDKGIHIVTVSSNEVLKNLYDMLDKKGQDALLNTPLIVPGHRCAELATQLGFRNHIEIATSATDESMLAAIINWHNHRLLSDKE